MRISYLSSIPYDLVVAFAPLPTSTSVSALMFAGGGGGMGSNEDMSYNEANPIPYNQYGGMGGPVLLDTLTPKEVILEGNRVFWPNHGLHINQGVYLTGPNLPTGAVARKPYFVMGIPGVDVLAPNYVYLSEQTYKPPGPPPFPNVPAPFIGNGYALLTPFAYTIPGSGGGGIQGDQSGPQAGIGFSTQGSAMFFAGESGSCTWAGGGRGGSNPIAAGGIEQFGTLMGNLPGFPGAGGGGGGLGVPTVHHPMSQQIGPSGGAAGSWGFVRLPLKSVYEYFCGQPATGGPAGPNGYPGAPGGPPAIIFIEGYVMKVFLIITIMILGDNQTMQGKIEVPNAQVCFQQAWKYLQQPQPEVAYLEVTCRFEPGNDA